MKQGPSFSSGPRNVIALCMIKIFGEGGGGRGGDNNHEQLLPLPIPYFNPIQYGLF